ncbi:MAG TPA: 16S rRNA (cytidine(1402)-2'-O)-methyltransferase [Acidimicrobiales bacterium]|nr:16S rRNA (cytidine(1402)-2'-O)-methyltransferase [Acidimicrobiales bacterium]
MTGGRLVLVATPIGNLGDLSPRAVSVLTDADIVCCEDTRRTRALLSAAGISGGRRLVSLHGHNEAAMVERVLDWVAGGRTVAVVSDAGTPSVSDPGARLVAAAADRDLSVSVVPGPSSVLAALVVSGLPTDRFCMEGFLPRKGADRRRRLVALATEERTTVLLEAPGRLAGTLADLLGACGDRPVALVRELTKVHEEIWRGGLARAVERVGERPPRGEVAVVMGGAEAPGPPTDAEVAAAVAERLAAGDSARRAADAVARGLGVSRHRAYEAAIVERDGERARTPTSSGRTSPPRQAGG